MCINCGRPITFQQSTDIRNALQNTDLSYKKTGILTHDDLDDIESDLLRRIIPENESVSGFYQPLFRSTLAGISFAVNGNQVCLTGISVKRKGDMYNERVGQILALLDLYHNTLEEEGDQDFSFRWV